MKSYGQFGSLRALRRNACIIGTDGTMTPSSSRSIVSKEYPRDSIESTPSSSTYAGTHLTTSRCVRGCTYGPRTATLYGAGASRRVSTCSVLYMTMSVDVHTSSRAAALENAGVPHRYSPGSKSLTHSASGARSLHVLRRDECAPGW